MSASLESHIKRSMSRIVLAALVFASVTESQSLSFEAASIKRFVPGMSGYESSGRSKIEYAPSRLSMVNVDLNDCIEWAYGVREDQISGGNNLGGERYEILAKATTGTPVGQLKIMLQNMLAERFKLKLRREQKLQPVYELTVAKRGPRLPAPKPDEDSSAHHSVESLPRVSDGSFVFSETSMAEFAQKLSMLQGVERPVLDRTGIARFYDITLRGAATAVRENDGSLFGIIQEQLGLQLVSSKQAMEFLVIEYAEKPAVN